MAPLPYPNDYEETDPNISPLTDTEKYGFYAQSDQNRTTWNDTLPLAPPLNISGGYHAVDFQFYGRQWIDPLTEENPFADEDRQQYAAGGEIYDYKHIRDHGQCQPSTDEVSIIPGPSLV